MFLLLSILFIIACSKTYAFNLDTKNAVIYEDPYNYLRIPSNKTSYFGYSLVLYPGSRVNGPWIQIGAPRGNNPNIRTQSNNPGVVFKCGIGEPCRMLDTDTEPEIPSGNSYINKLDGAWIGGSMDINYEQDRIVTCGFRWRNYKRSRNDYHMEGSCYWSHINDNSTQKLTPLRDTDREFFTGQSNVYYYAQGQAGFSLHLPASRPEMLLGAPGVFNWKGTTILIKDSQGQPPISSRFKMNRTKKFANSDEFADKNVANAINTQHVDDYALMGYSVTSGYFYGKGKLLYAAGGPRSNLHLGQVLVYDFSLQKDSRLDVKESNLHGEQFGEYFGAALTAGDINGDGFDDLIVGSPFYTLSIYNEGKVSVFLGSPKGRLEVGQALTGKSRNGQFGTALQFLGDIDHDGIGDLAVAAPYEDDSGVVYIFKGSPSGLNPEPSQKIVGKDLSREIRGFGISISRPADIDSNSYSDIAIGAYQSGHAVLLRTRPVVIIYQSMLPHTPLWDYNNEKQFDLQACFSFVLDQRMDKLDISRKYIIDEKLSRAFLVNRQNYLNNVTLFNNQMYCENLTLQLRDGGFTNHERPVTIDMSHEFLSTDNARETVYVGEQVQGTDRFCHRCPVYDKYRSIQNSTLEVPLTLGCGQDNICNTSLEMDLKILGIRYDNTFILGSDDKYVALSITLKNLGEKAYSTEVAVTLPEVINFKQKLSSCEDLNATRLCKVGSPLLENSQRTVTLDLDMSNVNLLKSQVDILNFTVTVLTTSINVNPRKTETILMKLKWEADVAISGKPGEQSIFYGNITDAKPNFTQVYQVEKFGISPVDLVSVEIDIPHAILGKSNEVIGLISLYPPTGSLASQPVSCRSNFSYIVELDGSDGDNIGLNSVAGAANTRRRRQVEVFNETNVLSNSEDYVMPAMELDMFDNRTFYINCSTPGIICSKIICEAGPFLTKQYVAEINLRMQFDFANITGLRGKKDIVVISTNGSIHIPLELVQSGNKPDHTSVSSLFVGETATEPLAKWVIIVSVIAGLLLMLLIVMALIKAGFFKRSKKEELEHLKAEMEAEAEAEAETEAEENPADTEEELVMCE